MRRLLFESAFTLLFAGLAAILVIPLSFVCLLTWAGWQWARSEGERSVVNAKTTPQAALLVAALLAAYLWPGKYTEQVLDRPVSLNSQSYTLAELYEATARPLRTEIELPIRTAWGFAEEDADQLVAFGVRRMSLREFVETIESQTSIRHRFLHCGNGWTLLRGGDCSFGLLMRDPALFRPDVRDRYEID